MLKLFVRSEKDFLHDAMSVISGRSLSYISASKNQLSRSDKVRGQIGSRSRSQIWSRSRARSDQGQGAISEGLQKRSQCHWNRHYCFISYREDNAKVAADSEKGGLKKQLQTIESFAKKQSDEISTYKKEVRCNMPVVKFYYMQKCSML